MSNELSYARTGLDVTLIFGLANLSTGAGTVDMAFAQGGLGFTVPAGYVFHPLCLNVTFTGTLDADATVNARVIANGTELANGPAALISQAATDTSKTGVARISVSPVAAGAVVGVSLTKSADYDATGTIDWDAVLIGKLLPA